MIPFSPPRIDEKIIEEVCNCLRSLWITTGPRTKEFEREINKFCGCKASLAVNSASFGLELALRWFGIGEGDEVIVPAYTYCATANVVVHCGAKPVMVDVNAEDFNINVKAIEKAITSRTKAIMPVDLAGFPCDYDEILALAEDKKALFCPKTEEQKKLGRILVLSDSAHSFGANYKGRRTGTLADISVFSFHAVKNLSTAEGGAIALNLPEPFDNEEIYKFLCHFSLHGQSKDALAKTQKGAWRYDVLECGYKGNMTDILASLGLVEISRYKDDTLKYRRRIFEQYQKSFALEPWAEVPVFETPTKCSSFHVYPLRIRGIDETKRDEIIQRIFDLDVAVNVHFQPLPLLSVFKNMGYKMADYPTAYDNYSREISLPVWYGLDEKLTDQVINAVKKAVTESL